MDDPFRLDYNTVHKIEKPPLPYIPGHELSVVRHYPSPPPPKWHGIALKYEAAREREHADILTRTPGVFAIPRLRGDLVVRRSI